MPGGIYQLSRFMLPWEGIVGQGIARIYVPESGVSYARKQLAECVSPSHGT